MDYVSHDGGTTWRKSAEHVREATAQQIISTGASGGYGVVDPVDGDIGYAPVGGTQGRPVPWWTLEKLRTFSVAGYRSNPMARAIVDTYTSFCVGDSGVKLQCSNDDAAKIAHEFWDDPRNRMADQDVALRSHMLNGETIYEMMTGPSTGVVRRSVIDPARLRNVELRDGNPLWIENLLFRLGDGTEKTLAVAQLDDLTGLRSGQAMFWASWRALETDVRGWPFLGPIVDWLDMYDNVLSNLVDRTALARYLVWLVTIDGDQDAVDAFIDARKRRGQMGAPKSGTVEVTNKSATWEAKTAEVGAVEDTTTSAVLLTNIAAGAGIAKTWLADPEHANRATSMTMAEPVRRRVGGVQNMWCAYQTELVRFAVDQAVKAGRLPAMVPTTDSQGVQTQESIAAALTVKVVGPEIAAQDAQITAGILFQLSQSLEIFKTNGILSPEACAVAAKLDDPTGGTVDDIATQVDQAMKAPTNQTMTRFMRQMQQGPPAMVGGSNGQA